MGELRLSEGEKGWDLAPPAEGPALKAERDHPRNMKAGRKCADQLVNLGEEAHRSFLMAFIFSVKCEMKLPAKIWAKKKGFWRFKKRYKV